MKNRHVLIAYGAAYASYVLRDSGAPQADIRTIYLFGSVARGDFDRDSDIDVFIDLREKEGIAARALKRFLASEEREKFRLMGVTQEIKPMEGKLAEWELKESVEKDGIVLYSAAAAAGLRPYSLLTLEPVSPVAKRNRVLRALAGRREKNFRGVGLVQQLGGETVDSRVFLLPAEETQKVLAVLSREKANYKTKKVWF